MTLINQNLHDKDLHIIRRINMKNVFICIGVYMICLLSKYYTI
jgi:hypothetical protein